MSLVIMLTDLETEARIGCLNPPPAAGASREILRPDDVEGLGALGVDGLWPHWEGRRVEVWIASTEAHPPRVRWMGWQLAPHVTDALFGEFVDVEPTHQATYFSEHPAQTKFRQSFPSTARQSFVHLDTRVERRAQRSAATTFFAVSFAEPGFWPVTRLPSTTA